MKGICFIEPLFHKVVKGEKTQTRRMIVSRTGYFQVESRNGVIFAIWQTDDNEWCGDNLVPVNPKYQVGEKVYLKEPYAETCDEYGSPLIAYRFDNTALYLVRKDGNGDYYQLNTVKKPVTTNWTINNFPACGEWKNKLFMPEWAARYFIEVTAVRAERLQDISEKDCIKEGIDRIDFPAIHFGIEEGEYFHWLGNTPQEAYAALINKINGKGTWEKNPFVWVYDFKLIEK
ncbi:MAG: hypothetical protein BGO30_08380 [Bacteroidetes bacterium 41-46]|nr:MAG: hypothetical protein BGO30_08380 [Bacteroidetes bacterium 41-46]